MFGVGYILDSKGNEVPNKEYFTEISKMKRRLEVQGYRYESYCFDEVGCVTSPTGAYLDMLTCLCILDERLRVGNWRQIEALKALELIYLYDTPDVLFEDEFKAASNICALDFHPFLTLPN